METVDIHDMKNKINYIYGYLQLAQMSKDIEEKDEYILKSIDAVDKVIYYLNNR
jgi:hypothetical protein